MSIAVPENTLLSFLKQMCASFSDVLTKPKWFNLVIVVIDFHTIFEREILSLGLYDLVGFL